MWRAAVRKRNAFTLIEIIVALAVAGLALAVVAPSLVLRPPRADVAIQEVVNTARRSAARRGQSLSLEIKADGRWVIRASSTADSLASGRLAGESVRRLHVRVTPLGMCEPEADTISSTRRTLDPLDCSWRDEKAAR